MTFHDDHAPPGTPPRVAFAVGRRAGGAVVRNRIRRRLRAAMRELAAEPSSLPSGLYLVGASSRAATMPFDELRGQLARAVAEATSGGAQ